MPHKDADDAQQKRHPDLEAVHTSMLDGLGQLSGYFGFSKVMGQLYGVLLLSPEPLSLDEMMDRLQISKASVSMNMRTLEHMGVVRQAWMPGMSGRRKYYEAETDFLQIMAHMLSGREMRDVDRAISVMEDNAVRLQAALSNMSDEDQALAKLYLDRMEAMEAMFRFARLVISSILNKVAEMDLDGVSQINIE